MKEKIEDIKKMKDILNDLNQVESFLQGIYSKERKGNKFLEWHMQKLSRSIMDLFTIINLREREA